MESCDYQQELTAEQVYTHLSDFSKNDIDYSILKLEEANLIKAIIHSYSGHIEICRLLDITYTGHEFLNNIRSNTVMETTKSICSKIGVHSIQAFTQIASSVVTTLIQSHLGL